MNFTIHLGGFQPPSLTAVTTWLSCCNGLKTTRQQAASRHNKRHFLQKLQKVLRGLGLLHCGDPNHAIPKDKEVSSP